MNKQRRDENYSDFIGRLFPVYDFHHINSGGCKQLTFQVTEACNLNCTYCYQVNKSNNSMTFDTAKQIVDGFFNRTFSNYLDPEKLTGIILEFIGGEPLLEIDLIDSVIEYFILQAYNHKSTLAYRFMISLCSNGVLYFDTKVQTFLKKWRKHLSLTISLDGCKELHDKCRVFSNGAGSYDIALKAAVEELKYNPNLSTKMTLAPENIAYFSVAIENLYNVGYRNIYCNCVFESGWEFQHAQLLYKESKKVAKFMLLHKDVNVSFFDEQIGQPLSESDNINYCGGTGLMLSFDYKGDAYPCIRYMSSSLGNEIEPFCIGDYSSGIGNREQEQKRLECLSCITRKSQSSSECFECPIASGCAWCSAYNYQCYGTPNKRATFICIMHKARVIANYYYWNMYYNMHHIDKQFKLNVYKSDLYNIVDAEEATCLLSLISKEE